MNSGRVRSIAVKLSRLIVINNCRPYLLACTTRGAVWLAHRGPIDGLERRCFLQIRVIYIFIPYEFAA